LSFFAGDRIADLDLAEPGKARLEKIDIHAGDKVNPRYY